MNKETIQEKIDMIIRQTDYNKETAETKFIEFNNDVMAVIRDYMKPAVSNTKEVKSSKNQQIYKEIRYMMDNAARNYEDKKVQKETEEEPARELNVILEEPSIIESGENETGQ
jgi:hypothetical protein